MSEIDLDMEDLAFADLDRTGESLYYTAKRYVAIAEASFIQEASIIDCDDPKFLRIGPAAGELVEAGQRYQEAHKRAFPGDGGAT